MHTWKKKKKVGLVEWLKVKAVSSSPSTSKKKKKKERKKKKSSFSTPPRVPLNVKANISSQQKVIMETQSLIPSAPGHPGVWTDLSSHPCAFTAFKDSLRTIRMSLGTREDLS
jgi:hypothetical protein